LFHRSSIGLWSRYLPGCQPQAVRQSRVSASVTPSVPPADAFCCAGDFSFLPNRFPPSPERRPAASKPHHHGTLRNLSHVPPSPITKNKPSRRFMCGPSVCVSQCHHYSFRRGGEVARWRVGLWPGEGLTHGLAGVQKPSIAPLRNTPEAHGRYRYASMDTETGRYRASSRINWHGRSVEVAYNLCWRLTGSHEVIFVCDCGDGNGPRLWA